MDAKERKEKENAGMAPPQAHNISPMEPVTHGAYGGGLYGTEEGQTRRTANKPPASESQSADGPSEPTMQPKHKPPPSSGDRDIDITGQSYIQ